MTDEMCLNFDGNSWLDHTLILLQNCCLQSSVTQISRNLLLAYRLYRVILSPTFSLKEDQTCQRRPVPRVWDYPIWNTL